MASRYKALNFAQLQTTQLRKRNCRLQVEMLGEMPDPAKPLQDFLRSLPRTGAAAGLFNAADAMAQAALVSKDIVWLVDAGAVEAGLSPLIIHLIHRGAIRAIAMTGGAAVRDYELAFLGMTREDVRSGLEDGLYGMARETGEGMNEIINEGVKRGFSLGECLGRGILDRQPKYYAKSILAACAARLVTATVHVTLGSDGFHCHPSADGAMIGKGSVKDLQILGARLDGLHEGGVLVAAHSNPGLQSVFHHALAVARNLSGPIELFSVLRFGPSPPDFSDVPGIAATHTLPGPYEIMLPLFAGVFFSLVE